MVGKVSSLKSHIGFWMRMVSNNVSYSFRRKLEDSGVTVAEWVILREMYGSDGTASPGSIAELTCLTKGAVSKLIDRLLSKGLCTRTESTHDRRCQEVGLSKKGMMLVPQLALLADKNDEEFFSVLTKTERKELMEILQKIVRIKNFTNVPIE